MKYLFGMNNMKKTERFVHYCAVCLPGTTNEKIKKGGARDEEDVDTSTSFSRSNRMEILYMYAC
jgi:hypothetical protein